MDIGIVGLGLIGGSLGLDLRDLGHRVLGVSARSSTCDTAVARGIVDEASPDLALLAAVEVVFICTPIGLIEPTVRRLVTELSPQTIITDVGSVKASIVAQIEPLWPNFVGGHPMAGTAYSGLDAALRQLFRGNPYVLTPTQQTPPRSIETLENLIKALGARLYHCDPQAHDRAVAWISHLPVMTSAALIAACISERDPAVLALAQSLASSGFRDTSRVGGGNPELGVMMAQYNRSALLQSLVSYREQLDHLIDSIEQADWAELTSHLTLTQGARSQFVE